MLWSFESFDDLSDWIIWFLKAPQAARNFGNFDVIRSLTDLAPTLTDLAPTLRVGVSSGRFASKYNDLPGR